MAVPVANRYRWVGRVLDADGARLAKVRLAPVATSWRPVEVSWIAETADRPTCDFPIFFPIVRCISRRALQVLAPCIDDSLEVLGLDGLGDDYVAIHCVRWIEGAVDFKGVDLDRMSIHSTTYVPRLRADVVKEIDIFGVPEMPAKLFVSGRVKTMIAEHALRGLEFFRVEEGAAP